MSDDFKPIMTAKELLNLDITDIPMLVDGFIQETGLVGLIGASDVAKSTLLRQLCLSIARGDENFLGFKLNCRTNKVIYVSTEDVMQDIAYLLRRQLGNPEEIEEHWDNLIFITDSTNLNNKLEELMEEHNPDCVIIDCFTDIFEGDMNMASSLRPYLNGYKELSQKHQSVFVMLNHVGKGKENKAPSKNNSLGSQSFEAKLRMVAELRRDQNDDTIRHLCIVKGNYIADEDKSQSYVLNFNQEHLLFENSGQRAPYSNLVRDSSLKDEWLPQCLELKAEDDEYTVDSIHNQLKAVGFNGSRSTVGNWLKNH